MKTKPIVFEFDLGQKVTYISSDCRFFEGVICRREYEEWDNSGYQGKYKIESRKVYSLKECTEPHNNSLTGVGERRIGKSKEDILKKL